MALWSVSFPAAEVFLESWGTIALVFYRQLLAIGFLLVIWCLMDGVQVVLSAPWKRGLGIGGLGFGLGGILLMVGQKYSDPVTPAIAASMMPIAGAILEVFFDKKRLTGLLLLGIGLALVGGLLAAGVRIDDGNFGFGAMLCVAGVFLFAWATRSTTRDFDSLSILGRTTITLVGSLIFVAIVYAGFLFANHQSAQIGAFDQKMFALLVMISLFSIALAQTLWIVAAGRLGVLVASFHMNAVPFYVMVVVVLFLQGEWRCCLSDYSHW